MSSIAARLALLALAIVLAAIAAEVALRALAPADEGLYVWSPGLVRTFEPSPGVMPGVEGRSVFRVNRLGLRGDDPRPGAAPRVLAVGGSTTECLYLDQEEAWPALLEVLLGERAWVANAGVSGRLTRDHVVQLELLLPLLAREPDARPERVVLLVGVNDLVLCLAQGPDYDPRGLDAPGEREKALARAFEVLPPRLASAPFPRSTALWRRVLVPIKARLAPPQVQDEAGAIYRAWRAHRAGASAFLDALPDLEPALEEYRRNVLALARVCAENGARPLFLTQPCLWREDLAPEDEALCWMGGVGDYQRTPGAAYYTVGALARGLDLYNAALLETCAAAGAECLDLAALVPRERSAFYDDVHFNEAGARLVAEKIAAALL